jgi:hypothetical protein
VVNRNTIKNGIDGKGATSYICPTCTSNTLEVLEGSFKHKETKQSRAMHDYEGFGPEHVSYIFSSLLQCSGKKCGEIVACSGIGYVDEFYETDEDGYSYPEYADRFFPKVFTPPLKLFVIPKETPIDTAEALVDSFNIAFINPASAANHVRVALEHLLTHLKVKRSTVSNNKRRALSLHARIDAIPAKYNHVKDLCFALKWVGNAGSHASSDVAIDNVLDIYDIYEELLREIFSGKSKNAKELAKLINKNKGPK